jgi:SNF2 family DNA or RNA helicase
VKVSPQGAWGVLEGLPFHAVQKTCEALSTPTEVSGTIVRFKPTRFALDYLVSQKATFAPECRTVWGHFYTKTKEVTLKASFEYKTKPKDYQDEEFIKHRQKKFVGLWWEMGLGKTKTALDIAAWKYLAGEIDAVLVVTLKNLIDVWTEIEAEKHGAVPFTAAFWNQNRVEFGMRGLIEKEGLIIAAINFDSIFQKKGMAFTRSLLTSRKTFIVVDESQGIKNPSSARTKALLKLGPLAVARMILTGTPMLSSPLDIWSQMEFLSPSILKMKFREFKSTYAIEEELGGITHEEWVYNPATGKSTKQTVPTKIVVGYKKLEDLRSRIGPHVSRLTKAEKLDLPPKVYMPTRTYELTPEARKAYKQMAENLIIDISGGRRVSAPIPLTKSLRLHQLVCNIVVPDDATAMDPNYMGEPFAAANPRMSVLMELLEGCSGKGIIWADYRYSLHEIHERLLKEYGSKSTVLFAGITSREDRRRAVDQFQDPKSPVRWFVGQPTAGGTGITLTEAEDTIYYSNPFSRMGLRKQTEDRPHRIGQERTVTYTDIAAKRTLELPMLRSLLGKHELAAEVTGDDLLEWLNVAD